MTPFDSRPTVSVVMAVYNGERHIAGAIESLLAQTYTDFELIIVDDGSSDSTPQILAQYAGQDKRIRIITNKNNSGLTKSLNTGIGHARGRYIARQDADDRSNVDRLSKQVALLETRPDIALVTSHFMIDDGTSQTVYRHHATDLQRRWAMLFYNHISGHTGVMFRKNVMNEIGGYDESFRYAQDYDLWERLSRQHEIAVIEDVLFTVNFHDQNLSKTKVDHQTDYALRVSQRQIEQLIGDIDNDTVRELYYFWVHQYDKVTDFGHIHVLLKRIFVAFQRKYHLNDKDEQVIREEIALRFWSGAGLRPGSLWLMWQWSARFTLRRIWKRLQS